MKKRVLSFSPPFPFFFVAFCALGFGEEERAFVVS
jgi:hypothetical protein